MKGSDFESTNIYLSKRKKSMVKAMEGNISQICRLAIDAFIKELNIEDQINKLETQLATLKSVKESMDKEINKEKTALEKIYIQYQKFNIGKRTRDQAIDWITQYLRDEPILWEKNPTEIFESFQKGDQECKGH